jgi:hypothetical protein
MAWCDRCEMDLSFCEHGLSARRDQAGRSAILRVSPRGIAHFDGCPHKGDDPDYQRWGELAIPGAWQRLGNGEYFEIDDNSGQRLTASTRCSDCLEHGPW